MNPGLKMTQSHEESFTTCLYLFKGRKYNLIIKHVLGIKWIGVENNVNAK